MFPLSVNTQRPSSAASTSHQAKVSLQPIRVEIAEGQKRKTSVSSAPGTQSKTEVQVKTSAQHGKIDVEKKLAEKKAAPDIAIEGASITWASKTTTNFPCTKAQSKVIKAILKSLNIKYKKISPSAAKSKDKEVKAANPKATEKGTDRSKEKKESTGQVKPKAEVILQIYDISPFNCLMLACVKSAKVLPELDRALKLEALPIVTAVEIEQAAAILAKIFMTPVTMPAQETELERLVNFFFAKNNPLCKIEVDSVNAKSKREQTYSAAVAILDEPAAPSETDKISSSIQISSAARPPSSRSAASADSAQLEVKVADALLVAKSKIMLGTKQADLVYKRVTFERPREFYLFRGELTRIEAGKWLRCCLAVRRMPLLEILRTYNSTVFYRLGEPKAPPIKSSALTPDQVRNQRMPDKVLAALNEAGIEFASITMPHDLHSLAGSETKRLPDPVKQGNHKAGPAVKPDMDFSLPRNKEDRRSTMAGGAHTTYGFGTPKPLPATVFSSVSGHGRPTSARVHPTQSSVPAVSIAVGSRH